MPLPILNHCIGWLAKRRHTRASQKVLMPMAMAILITTTITILITILILILIVVMIILRAAARG